MVAGRNGARKRKRVLGAGLVAVVLLLVATDAAAARSPLRTARRCRRVIGHGVLELARIGLDGIDACHRARNRGRKTRPDCNLLDDSPGNMTSYQRTRNKVAQFIVPEFCTGADAVLANYPGTTPQSAVAALMPALKRVLEESSGMLQGAPSFVGDRATVRPLRRCHRSVGAARSQVLTKALAGAVRCQAKLDARVQTFGPIDPICLGGAGALADRARARLARGCAGISGLAVGSCAELPDCAIAAAEAQALALARLTYGGPGQCGDGFHDLDEQCDDGNLEPGDGCEPSCRLPGAVQCDNSGTVDPGEECDDGNNRNDDNCLECRASVCGDGFVDVEEPSIEECDDGNAVAGDGCTDCRIDGKLCRADGIVANVAFEYSAAITGDILGMFAQLAYAPPLAIPGSGPAASVRERVASQLPANVRFIPTDNDTDGDAVDDQVRMLITVDVGGIPPGPLARLHFDCPQGTLVRPGDLPCTLDGVSDSSGQLIPPERLASEGVRCLVASLEGDTPLPTTTLPGATTTTAPLPTTTSTSVTSTTVASTTSSSTTTTASTTTTTSPSTTSTTSTTTSTSTTTTTAPTTSTTSSTTTSTVEASTSTTSSTSTTTVVTATTTSTTSTTIPAVVSCGPSGLDVTAILVYEPRITGDVFAMFMLVNYPTSVSIPGTGTASTARARFTNLLGTQYRLVPSDVDSNGDTVDDQGRTLVSSSTAGIPPAPVERIRFDCAGPTVTTAGFSCVIDQPSDSSGQIFPPEVADLITCRLELAPAQ